MSRRILTFSLFEAARTAGLTQEQKAFLKRYTSGTWTYNPSTGLVDVDGDFDCSNEDLVNFKGVKFGKVSGNFDCNRNKLVSLKGAPQEVGGDFICWRNTLTSLAGSPQKVGESFICWNNFDLHSLEGGPKEVGREFDCNTSGLRSLAGAPQKVGGDFKCRHNDLTSLEGSPKEVGGSFDCPYNQLTSLKGAPQKVRGNFTCRNNRLTTLEGAPQEVGGNFNCDAFELEQGEWNLKGLLKILTEGSPEAQKLILTLMSPEVLNVEIQKDPTGMIMKLKEVWNEKSFRETRDKLVWPRGYEKEADLLGDLDDVGF